MLSPAKSLLLQRITLKLYFYNQSYEEIRGLHKRAHRLPCLLYI